MVHPLLRKMQAEAFRLLFLWIHEGEGRAMRMAELCVLGDRSSYHVRKVLRSLAGDGLATYNGLADQSLCALTPHVFNLFVFDNPWPTGGQVQIGTQPTGFAQPTEPLAGQPTVHQPSGENDPVEMSLVASSSFLDAQKKIFFAQKKFFPEEEDLINLNLIKSSSSESSTPDEKKFFPPDLEDRLKALEVHGRFFSQRVREELARLEHCTPAYVRAMACKFYHVEERDDREGGMLRRRILEKARPPDQLCMDCWLEAHPPEEEPEPDLDELTLAARSQVVAWVAQGEVVLPDAVGADKWPENLFWHGQNDWQGVRGLFFNFGDETGARSLRWGREQLAERLGVYFSQALGQAIQVHF